MASKNVNLKTKLLKIARVFANKCAKLSATNYINNLPSSFYLIIKIINNIVIHFYGLITFINLRFCLFVCFYKKQIRRRIKRLQGKKL